MTLLLEDIDVGDKHRSVDSEAVRRLSKSIKDIGLQYPITAIAKDGRFSLVAGRHRLEAFRQNGEDRIPAYVVKLSDRDARMWEIAENLHRAELTVVQRAEQVAEYAELAKEKREAEKVSAQLAHKAPHRPEGGDSLAGRDLGITRDEVRRAKIIAALPEQTKLAAVDAGLDDNQSALLRVAKENTAVSQLEAIRREKELAEARKANRTINDAIALTEAEQFAGWLQEHAAQSEIPQIISWLEGCKPKDVIAALRREAA